LQSIVSVGVDMVNVARIRRDIKEYPDMIERFLSKDEMARYSGLLAIKEAVIKTLQPSVFDGTLFRDIIVEGHPPIIVLLRKAKKLAQKKGIKDIKVSVSHEDEKAIAIAIATRS
jgi:holo-[acyl-carrier protein] synthase